MDDKSVAQECVLQAEDRGKQRFCECGQPFETNRETQKRCRNCRKAFRNRNKASKRKATKAEFCGPPKPRGPYLHKLPKSMSCRVCGVEFTPKVPKACYCSNECKLAKDYEDRRYRYAEKRGFVDLRKSPKHSDRECSKCWKTYRPTSSRQKMCKTCKDAMELRIVACNDCGAEFKQNSGTHRLCSVCRKARKNKLDRARYRQKMNGLDDSQKGYREKTCRDCQCRFKPNGATQKMCKACSAAATRKWNSEKSKIEKHKEK